VHFSHCIHHIKDCNKISSQAFQIKCNGVTGLLPYSAQNYAGMYSLEPLLIADKLPTQWAVRMKFIPLERPIKSVQT